MKAHFEIKNDLPRRLVYARMTGLFTREDMQRWAAAYRVQATTPYGGKRHMVIANMLGMKTVHPSIAEMMGNEIGHARSHGVVLCVHLSDDTVQRLQAARIARKNSPFDDATVDVDSMSEGRRIVALCGKRIDDPRFSISLRDALTHA